MKGVVKKTLGKNGKGYCYQGFGSIEKKEFYWRRIPEDEFNFFIKDYERYATSCKRDNNNNVIYLEWFIPKEDEFFLSESRIDKEGNIEVILSVNKKSPFYKEMKRNKKSGCATALVLLLTIIYFIL